jgi:hypothetical protein
MYHNCWRQSPFRVPRTVQTQIAETLTTRNKEILLLDRLDRGHVTNHATRAQDLGHFGLGMLDSRISCVTRRPSLFIRSSVLNVIPTRISTREKSSLEYLMTILFVTLSLIIYEVQSGGIALITLTHDVANSLPHELHLTDRDVLHRIANDCIKAINFAAFPP